MPWLINAFMLVLVAGVSLGGLGLVSVILGGARRSSAPTAIRFSAATIVILAVFILRLCTITI